MTRQSGYSSRRPSDCQSVRARTGHALLEFTIVALPMIALLMSIEEMARAVWTYVNLAHAVREGVRYAIVHGADCGRADNSCQSTVSDIAHRIRRAALGLDPSHITVVMKSAGTVQNCAPLTVCLNMNTPWPVPPDDNVGLAISIDGSYPFYSVTAVVIPNTGAIGIGAMIFTAHSREEIRF